MCPHCIATGLAAAPFVAGGIVSTYSLRASLARLFTLLTDGLRERSAIELSTIGE